MDSYDNDFLFYLDDDLFCVWPENLISPEELKKNNKIRAKAKEEDYVSILQSKSYTL